jgi:hypothetical protein
MFIDAEKGTSARLFTKTSEIIISETVVFYQRNNRIHTPSSVSVMAVSVPYVRSAALSLTTLTLIQDRFIDQLS